MNEISKKINEALNSFSLSIHYKARGKNDSYALIVKNGFDTISKFLKEGATFTALFEHLAACGILSENGNPDSLRRAYRREAKRREKRQEVHDTKKSSKQTPKVMMAEKQTENTPSGEENSNTDEIKRKLGTQVDTGTSRITKYADGSFDF